MHRKFYNKEPLMITDDFLREWLGRNSLLTEIMDRSDLVVTNNNCELMLYCSVVYSINVCAPTGKKTCFGFYAKIFSVSYIDIQRPLTRFGQSLTQTDVFMSRLFTDIFVNI